jgi:GR25 family glycosyltransferase involved in LPS biosynthesis
MELLKNCLYINLDHRTDRLLSIHSEMKKMGIEPERFNAIKPKDGAIGCSMSHIKCLQLAKERNWEHVFICEDDIIFTDKDKFIDSITKFNDTMKDWDVCIVSGNNAPPYKEISDFCVKIQNCRCTSGYIVKRHYYDTLLENFRTGLKKFIREPTNGREYAIDVYWNQLQQTDNWYLIIPLTVLQSEGYSDVENRVVDYKFLMQDLEKKWLVQQHYNNLIRNSHK